MDSQVLAMQLKDIAGPDIALLPEARAIDITGMSSDSRTVQRGTLFAALAGARADGAKFIADAVSRGASAVLLADGAAVPDGIAVPVLRAAEPRRALALMAARFFGKQPDVTVAVTGTNGKTSVADFTRQIFAKIGRAAASLGTIGLVKPGGSIYGSLTTPDPIGLHRTLAELAGEGVTHLAFEASSHGLDQYRLDGVKLTAGAFTNLGRDHLDYHPDIESYLAAKLRLFRELLQPGQTAVINMDGPRAEDAQRAAAERGLDVLSVGSAGRSLRLQSVTMDGFAQRLAIEHDGRMHDVLLPLPGAYQTANALVAAGLAIAAGEKADAAIDALGALRGVPGRLDVVGQRKGGLAVVDYAHKPEALEAALAALRPFANGKLICVFGCGGDRDKGKRPIMGRIAVENADVTIVTDDNPRTEVPAEIRRQILEGARGAVEIGDRAAAINAGVDMMGPGDVVLVAGKGHETGQIVADRVLPFSDHETLRAALERS